MSVAFTTYRLAQRHAAPKNSESLGNGKSSQIPTQRLQHPESQIPATKSSSSSSSSSAKPVLQKSSLPRSKRPIDGSRLAPLVGTNPSSLQATSNLPREASTDGSFRSRQQQHRNPSSDKGASQARPPIPGASSRIASPQSSTSPKLRRKPSVIGDFKAQRLINPVLGAVQKDSLDPENFTALPSNTSTAQQPVQQYSGSKSDSQLAIKEHVVAQSELPGRCNFQTPLSEQSTTPSLTHDSPSIFSQSSHTSINTPTSLSGYSPRSVQSPHFGPNGASRSPRSILLKRSSAASPDRDFVAAKVLHYRSPQVHPPELAHLTTATPPQTIGRRPRRPSRDGVEDLMDLRRSPLVTTTYLPNPSQQYKAAPTISTDPTTDRFTSPAAADSLLANGTSKEAVGGTMVSGKSSSRSPIKLRPLDTSADGKTKTSPILKTSSPSSASTPRSFKSFFRKPRSTPVSAVDEATMQFKKGPAAGTGHEGYGRYAANRLSNGSTSTKRASSGSGFSSGSDDFISRKGTPVYIRKDTEGRLVPSDFSSTTLYGSRDSQVGSTLSTVFSPISSQPVMPKYVGSTRLSIAGSNTSSRGQSSRGRGSWTGSFQSERPRKLSKDRKVVAVHTTDDRQTSKKPERSAIPVPSTDSKLDADARDKKITALKSFFSKSPQKSKLPVVGGKPLELSKSVTPMPIAHYAMDFTEDDEHLRITEIGQILGEAIDTHGDSDVSLDLRSTSFGQTKPAAQSSEEVRLTLPPDLRKERSHRQAPTDSAALEHQANLKVGDGGKLPRPTRSFQTNHQTIAGEPASTAQGQRTIAAQSFSRPFVSTQPRPFMSQELSAQAPVTLAQPDLSTKALFQASIQSRRAAATLQEQNLEFAANAGSETVENSQVNSTNAFLRMRQDSNQSYSSSSGSFHLSTAAATAILPRAGTASSPDEVWDEYNDIIGALNSNYVDGSGSQLRPNEGCFSREAPNVQTEASDNTSKTPFPKLTEIAASLREDSDRRTSLSPFQGIGKKSPDFSGFQHPALRGAVTTPKASVECVDDTKLVRRSSSANRRNQTDGRPKTTAPSNLHSNGTGLKRSISSSSISSSSNEKASSRRRKIPEEVGLKQAALNASKWLTFGRHLVSPAQDLVKESDEKRILIVDGIGRDWPQFCAENCPEADVWGLSPDPYQPSQRSPARNFHHIRQNELDTSFPFPDKHFFTVVFRFPAATSEHNLRYALQECKRVLCAGGYLEVVLLDLDLTNMGPRARRAVKDLKIKLQAKNPDVCLKSASDHVQYLIGRNGLENLNRCFVGVPVFGQISGSPSQSRDESRAAIAEFTSDHPSAQSDEDMTKIVAKVGRWWYSQCYEKELLASDASISSVWDDQALLRECKESLTMLKLFVCYAQNPTLNKRQTRSL